jgi:hypothetical protein
MKFINPHKDYSLWGWADRVLSCVLEGPSSFAKSLATELCREIQMDMEILWPCGFDFSLIFEVCESNNWQ